MEIPKILENKQFMKTYPFLHQYYQSNLMLLFAAILLILIQYGGTECSLNRFPQEIFFANSIDGRADIEEYVETLYPLMSADLSFPLESGDFKKIDFSKKFVKNSPFPNHIVPIVIGDIVMFQVMDLRNQNVVQQSGNFSLENVDKCQYIFLPSYPFNLSSIFIHCQNQTHFKDSIIKRFLDPKCTITSLASYKNYQSYEQQVYYQMKYGQYPTVSDVTFLYRLGKDCIIDLYTESSSFSSKFQRTCVELGKEIKGEFVIADFRIQSNISKLFVLETGKLVISISNTFYNIWYIDGQKFLKSISLCQTSITAIISSSFLYFVSIDLTPGSLMFIMFEQIARIKLEKPLSNQIEMNSVGKYVIVSDGKQWKVFYMQDGKIKMMVFDCQINVSEIYIDNMLCGTDVFYFRNKKYTLGTMKIIRKNQPQQKITLIAKDCSKTIILKTMNSSDIFQVNSKNSLLCRDGTLKIQQKVCVGNNLTQKLLISGQQYPIKNKQLNLSFSQQALQYMELNQGIIVLTKKSSAIRIYAFIDDYAIFKDIGVTGNIESIKMIRKDYKNYYSQTTIVVFLTLNNNGQKLVQLCLLSLQKMPGSKEYQLYLQINEWNYDFFGLYAFQFMNFQITTIISSSWFGYQEVDLNIQINLIGLTKVKQTQLKTKFFHIKAFFRYRYSGGIQFVRLDDQESVDVDGMCKVEQNIVILYKKQPNAIQLTLLRDISDFYQILNTNKRVYNKEFSIVCGMKGLLILFENSIEIIDKNLAVKTVYHFNQPTKDDIIISDYIVHKLSFDIVQIYCRKTGLLIKQMKGVNIKDVVPSWVSKGILLKNGSYYFMEEYQTITDVQTSLSFASLICSNSFNSIFKFKALQTKNTLSLSTIPSISIPSSTTKLNFMNSTIQSLQVFLDSQYKTISHIKQIKSDSSSWGKYSVLIINGTNIFSGCRVDNYNYIDCLAVIYEADERLLTQWLVSLSEGANNRFVQVFANRTMLEVVSYVVGEDKMTLINSSMFCRLEASLSGEDYMFDPSAKHSLIDEKYLFLLRDQIETWSSHSSFFTIDSTVFPKAFRNANSQINKIEIYGLNGECKIDEIIPQKFGINKSISDFVLLKRKGSTFVIVILVNEILIFQYPFSSSKRQFYHAQLTQQFIAITATNDRFVLLSQNNDHKMYRIHWQSFPLAGTIQLQKTFIKTGEQPIVDGTMSNDMLLAYSKTNVFIFYLDSKNGQIYSSENRHMNSFKLDDYFHCAYDQQAGIDYIKYQEDDKFTMGIIGEYCQDYLQLQVMPMVDLQRASKIRLTNRKYSKEYSIVYENNLQEE